MPDRHGAAAAVVTGASLSGVATGAVQDLLRTAGFGQNSEIRAEQRRQALVIERIELSDDTYKAIQAKRGAVSKNPT